PSSFSRSAADKLHAWRLLTNGINHSVTKMFLLAMLQENGRLVPNVNLLERSPRSPGLLSLGLLLMAWPGWCQETQAPKPIQPGTIDASGPVRGDQPPEPERKRIFGIVPNYRTYPSLTDYEPLTAGEKFKIGAQDSFDRGTFILAAAFAGEAQLTNSNPSFGTGAAAYGRYLGTAYADFVIGDFMTESIFPSLLHQDPRYFRRGTGSVVSRLGYAVGQLFWTHTDSGGMQFNISEVGGNATAVAISTAYYQEGRDVSSAVSKFGAQIGVDMGANILKEFSPDIYRKLTHKPR
ncbi:MAG: hypothetical protein M3Y72_02840, partial [Acidobacteriota bacterium]|nr:hypothetical protein [Acidobacteriota bacterium]